jgi:hypothetical protein
VVLAGTELWAQPVETPSIDTKQASYLQVGFINGTSLFYQNQLGPQLELRSGLSGLWNYSESGDGTGSSRSSGTVEPADQDRTSSSLSSRIVIVGSSTLLFRFNEYKYATIYLGAGPAISYTLDKYSSNSTRSAEARSEMYSSESSSREFGIGPSVSVLIRTHLYEGFYLYSEYNLTGYYTWYSNDSNSASSYQDTGSLPTQYSSTSHLSSNGWKIDLSNVRIGLMFAL